MSTENKTVDLSIEANIPFGLVMQFQDITTDSSGAVTDTTNISLAGYTFRGSIKTDLSSPTILQNFSFTVIDSAKGILSMSLSKTQTAAIAAAAQSTRDKYNPRLRFVGYYDIILTKSSTNTEFRVLEGKIFISDGVTT